MMRVQKKVTVFVGGMLFLLGGIPSAFSASSFSDNSKSTWLGNSESSSRSRRSSELDVNPFSPGSHNVSLNLGQVFLMGDLSSNYNDSIGVNANYTYAVSDLFGFDTRLGYSEHSDGNYKVFSLLTGLRMNLNWYDRVIPYGVMGLGFYRPSRRVPAELNGGSGDSIAALLFGLHIGPGVDLQLSRQIYFGTQLTFHSIFGSQRMLSTGPISLGGTFTALMVHVGYSFN